MRRHGALRWAVHRAVATPPVAQVRESAVANVVAKAAGPPDSEASGSTGMGSDTGGSPATVVIAIGSCSRMSLLMDHLQPFDGDVRVELSG